MYREIDYYNDPDLLNRAVLPEVSSLRGYFKVDKGDLESIHEFYGDLPKIGRGADLRHEENIIRQTGVTMMNLYAAPVIRLDWDGTEWMMQEIEKEHDVLWIEDRGMKRNRGVWVEATEDNGLLSQVPKIFAEMKVDHNILTGAESWHWHGGGDRPPPEICCPDHGPECLVANKVAVRIKGGSDTDPVRVHHIVGKIERGGTGIVPEETPNDWKAAGFVPGHHIGEFLASLMMLVPLTDEVHQHSSMHWHGDGPEPNKPGGIKWSGKFEVMKGVSKDMHVNSIKPFRGHSGVNTEDVHSHIRPAKYVFPSGGTKTWSWTHKNSEYRADAAWDHQNQFHLFDTMTAAVTAQYAHYYENNQDGEIVGEVYFDGEDKHLPEWIASELSQWGVSVSRPTNKWIWDTGNEEHGHVEKVKNRDDKVACRLDVQPFALALLKTGCCDVVFFGIEGRTKADAIMSVRKIPGMAAVCIDVPSVGQTRPDELPAFVKLIERWNAEAGNPPPAWVIGPDADWSKNGDVRQAAFGTYSFLVKVGVDQVVVAAAPTEMRLPLEGENEKPAGYVEGTLLHLPTVCWGKGCDHPDHKGEGKPVVLKGVDDYLAHGGTLEGMHELARVPINDDYEDNLDALVSLLAKNDQKKRNLKELLRCMAMGADADGSLPRGYSSLANMLMVDESSVSGETGWCAQIAGLDPQVLEDAGLSTVLRIDKGSLAVCRNAFSHADDWERPPYLFLGEDWQFTDTEPRDLATALAGRRFYTEIPTGLA